MTIAMQQPPKVDKFGSWAAMWPEGFRRLMETPTFLTVGPGVAPISAYDADLQSVANWWRTLGGFPLDDAGVAAVVERIRTVGAFVQAVVSRAEQSVRDVAALHKSLVSEMSGVGSMLLTTTVPKEALVQLQVPDFGQVDAVDVGKLPANHALRGLAPDAELYLGGAEVGGKRRYLVLALSGGATPGGGATYAAMYPRANALALTRALRARQPAGVA